jgi:hypothetical protein
MANMTILEAAEHFGISKEAIHNRVRRGSLVVSVIEGVKMVDVDAKVTPKTKTTNTRKTATSSNDKYHKFLEEQNARLQTRVDTLEGETRSLRDHKEDMLLQERMKIEEIYKEKDEQLKNILTTLSSQFMLSAPIEVKAEEHVEAEIEIEKKLIKKEPKKGALLSLKKYLKTQNFSQKKEEKIKLRFKKKAKKDERIIVINSKFYLDTFKYDYSDLF